MRLRGTLSWHDEPAYIAETAVIDAPLRPLLGGHIQSVNILSRFGPNVWIGTYAVLQPGVTIGADSIIGDGCIVESRVKIGSRVLLTYRAHVCEAVSIGDDSIVGGFVGERTTIGRSSRIFGSVVHSHHDPIAGWDAPSSMEPGAEIKDSSFVGFGALITGAVRIGPRAYVCAGAIVSRDVPAMHVAYGVNKVCPSSEWRGPLRDSPLFSGDSNA